MKSPLPFEELKRILLERRAGVDAQIADYEAQYPDAQPLAPMTKDEALDALLLIMQVASARALTRDEIFLHGQLLAVYEQAALVAAKGYAGRWFLINEEQLLAMTAADQQL